jgi:hypothetical protein
MGGVFVTGHDPDYHAVIGASATGARQLIQRAIAYVTFDKANPRLLLVTDLRNPGGDQSDPRSGLVATGLAFDVADYGSGAAGVLDLRTVGFGAHDAVVVASDFGGWLRQDELAVLNARAAELLGYVNHGGGLVALNESGNRPGGAYLGTTGDRFHFLPFLVSGLGLTQSEVGVTVTPDGAAMGLTNSDVNGNAAHSVFTAAGGMDVIDRDSGGEILSLATRGKFLTPCGVSSSPTPGETSTSTRAGR